MTDWWSKNLGGQPAQRQSTPTSPLPNVRYVPEGNVHSTPVTYDPNADQLMTKSQAAKQTESCPGCMSGNYFAAQGSERKRCYDCGYPIVQSGTGAGFSTNSGGPATPAKQVSNGSGFSWTIGEKM
jgi:hypothetical protein